MVEHQLCGLSWRTTDDDGVSDLIPATTHICGVRNDEATYNHEYHTCHENHRSGDCGYQLWTPTSYGKPLGSRLQPDGQWRMETT